MQIQKTGYAPTFSAEFVNNKAFKDVVQYAKDNGCMRTLDAALNTIKKANNGKISILHGTTSDGLIYSTFTTGRRSVSNSILDAKSPAEASFDGILELSTLTKKFKSLLGVSKVEQNISPESLIKEYTV